MFQHVTHDNKNMEKMMIEMLGFKSQQQHEIIMIKRCQYAIQEMKSLKHKL